jgi:tRNA(fMet)-specific endonuclease VapC
VNSILLDTSAYTALINGDNRVYEYIVQSGTVYLSTVMLGELYAGFYGGSKFEWNKSILNNFLEKETVTTIDVTHGTAKIFGSIKNELKQKAKMIPINDIWIGAHAIETDSTLLAYDIHFSYISDLTMWTQ